MATEKDYQGLYDRIAALREQVASQLSADLISNPQLADAITKQIDDMLASVVERRPKLRHRHRTRASPPSAGVGPEAARDFGLTRIPPGVEPYDETITSERIMAVGDMYYLWQHEKIGVFRAVQKLQELFKAGTVRLSAARRICLYQFDRRDVLRYTKKRSPGRLQAHLRIRRRTGAHRLARQHRLPQTLRALRSPGHVVLARQAHFRRDPRARLRSQLRIDRHRAARRTGSCATT